MEGFAVLTEAPGNAGSFTHDYYYMAVNIATKYNNRGVPMEDLVQEALIELMLCEKKWTPTKGSRNKWASSILHFCMIDCAWWKKKFSKERSFTRTSDTDDDYLRQEPEAKVGWFERIKSELSEDAQFLITLIVNAPEDLVKDITTRNPARTKQAVKSYLIDVRDWSEEQFNQKWDEVDAALVAERKTPEEQLADLLFN